MKKIITSVLSLSVLSGAFCAAQTFNPRVVVENTFEGKIIEAGKQPLPMSVPDSLYQFQYQLDYSVFDNPYRGSYQFQPYRIEMKPDAAPSAARSLYASLGAGYSLHPEADVVWSPTLRSLPLKLSVYDRFRGFMGRYGMMTYDVSKERIPGHPTFPSRGQVLDNKVGADLRYEFGNVALEFDGGYHLLATEDTLTRHFLQLGEVQLSLVPLNPNRADYFYGARVYVNAGQDRYNSLMSNRHKLGVNNMGTDVSFGVPLSGKSRVLVDLGLETDVYSGALEGAVTRMWVTPRYQISWRGGSADLGVKLSGLRGSDNTTTREAVIRLSESAFQHKSSYFYPAVKVRQFLIPGRLSVYAKAEGGDCLNSYAADLFENPFTDPLAVVPNLDSSSERLNAALGLDGDFSGKLHFDLHGGYAVRKNWRTDAVTFTNLIYESPEGGWKGNYLTPYYNYCDYTMWYADLSALWKSARLDLDGHLRFQTTDLVRQAYIAVAPARWSGELQATYNWNRQAFAGLSLGWASRREGRLLALYTEDYPVTPGISVAGWLDLGLHGRYVINPRWSVWAKAGNLLGQSVQHYFMRPEKGPYGTVGITFNL